MSATPADLETVRVSFCEQDPYTILFEVDLCNSEQAFSFGTDTKLGNYDTNGFYDDSAALIATIKDNKMEQISMFGAKSEPTASSADPSFVIAPVGELSADNCWLGIYDMRRAYAYNTTIPAIGGGHGTETVDAKGTCRGLGKGGTGCAQKGKTS